MLHARGYFPAFSVFRLISVGISFVSFVSLLGPFDLDTMIIDSAVHDTVKDVSKDPVDALNSLSYHVEGEWLFCNESGETFNLTDFTSLEVIHGQQGRKKKIVHFQTAADTDGCKDYSSNEPLRFLPRALVPITTCADDDMYCKNEHLSNESLPIPIDAEYRRFTSQQAAQCLRNQRILMIGDSHMRNFWRALMDVIVGNLQHDYHRWDGYGHWHDFPNNISWDEVDQFLPNTMYARMNDHSKIGVSGACSYILEAERNPNVTGAAHYWNCLSAKSANTMRRKFDLRRLESNVTSLYNISLDASWCASSFRAGLDDNAENRGKSVGDNQSYLERLLSETAYDTVIVGHHVHDVKREHCLKEGTNPRECREDLGKDLIKNTERFASWAKEKNINLVWVTTGPMLLDRIPEQFRSFQLPDDMDKERKTTARIMRSKGFPVLDAYHIAAACDRKERTVRANGGEWPPCFSDGMHASRFLDRAKAQMLLNWKCS